MLTAENKNDFQKLSPNRDRRLFEEFLPIGYKLTTLDTAVNKAELIQTKVLLGSIITLYDDYADRPDKLNPKLLGLLYKVPFEDVHVHPAFLSKEERLGLSLAKTLFENLFRRMSALPGYDKLIELFHFDLKQFFLANQYSEQLTKMPELANSLENKLYLHHNMGIVMAGMIDLMSLPAIDTDHLGEARSLLLYGQRAGRISNVITTLQRELVEGDVTNEILSEPGANKQKLKAVKLEQEFDEITRIIATSRSQLFDAKKYAEGIKSLHQLHLRLQGVI